jgi:hypothetical protein
MPSHSYTRFLPSSNSLFALDPVDRDLVRDFLFAFSRAEYALKASGFVTRGASPEPRIQWDEFAREIATDLANPTSDEVSRAKQYLNDYPPMKQVYRQSSLRWEARVRSAEQTPETFLIRSVTQVRNNLFHGGKELRGPLAERDRRLVHSALTMVAFAVSVHDRVAMYYGEVGPRVAA